MYLSTIWLWEESVDAETSSCSDRLGAGTPRKEIDRHQRMYLSSTYPSRYYILIAGLEKPLSDSLWNDNLAWGTS
jgi:hypothetical protein